SRTLLLAVAAKMVAPKWLVLSLGTLLFSKTSSSLNDVSARRTRSSACTPVGDHERPLQHPRGQLQFPAAGSLKTQSVVPPTGLGISGVSWGQATGPPLPATIATYCSPPMLYVTGVELREAFNVFCHNILPVAALKARKRRSREPAKTSPPAVVSIELEMAAR